MTDLSDAEKRGCTLIRILLYMQSAATIPGAVSGQQVASFGIGLTSGDAFAASAFPDANETTDFPVLGWLFRRSWLIKDETLAAGGSWDYNIIDVDLRAARKLDRSEVFYHVFNAPLEGTSFNVRMHGSIRILYKLP